MIMKRTFHPVGQGAFYTECFCGISLEDGMMKTFNMVYDCGSSSESINGKVEAAFDERTTIDAVFISHFDSDHINGIEHLLQYCNVKKIFIPLLDNSTKSIVIASWLIKGKTDESFEFRFIENPQETVDELIKVKRQQECNVIQVSTDVYNTNQNTDGQNNPGQGAYHIDEGIPNKIKSGVKIVLNLNHKCLMEWNYIPFNFKYDERCSKIQEYIEEHPIPRGRSELRTWWSEHSAELKRIYKKIKGNLNTNSMVLYSGPDTTEKNGCLYTGDYEAKGSKKFRTLKGAYQEYWYNIHTLQIPHHGSDHNCDHNLIDLDAERYIISYGTKNTHGHPGKKLLATLGKKLNRLSLVTECLETKYCELFCIGCSRYLFSYLKTIK